MKWVPFMVGCVASLLWCSMCRTGHLTTYTTVTTSLLVGLMIDAWMRIPPRGLGDRE